MQTKHTTTTIPHLNRTEIENLTAWKRRYNEEVPLAQAGIVDPTHIARLRFVRWLQATGRLQQ